MIEDDFWNARKNMVDNQIAGRGVLDPHLLTVMRSVPRHLFVPIEDLPWAHADGPLPIPHGQTISQPYIVALMTELLQVKSTHRILEVGTGSGYQAAVLGQLAAEVHTVEVIPELASQATRILADLGYSNIHVHTGDGSLGWPDAAPYEGILVAAAAPSAPQPLLDQLADGGQMVIPVGSRAVQQLEVWTRAGQKFECKVKLVVAFVPLRGKFGWK
jgi:protein-L-isoaspartate(D-aspartate) O-methyltransferase